MKKISILHTGGTIASKVDYETGAVVAKFEPEDLYALYPELKALADFRIVKVANIMSEDADFGFINKLALAVKEEIEKGANGIIITHGTDTMHYTSAALHFM
ncbi:MAG: Glu-tRNA(Gln) amidotransferase GatDE subunit D, partial [Euryarchaeota archaeon HGW-Euryarchaeota-1]